MILYKEIWRTLDPPLASSRSQVRESADVTKYRANLCQNVLGKYNYHYLNQGVLYQYGRETENRTNFSYRLITST